MTQNYERERDLQGAACKFLPLYNECGVYARVTHLPRSLPYARVTYLPRSLPQTEIRCSNPNMV